MPNKEEVLNKDLTFESGVSSDVTPDVFFDSKGKLVIQKPGQGFHDRVTTESFGSDDCHAKVMSPKSEKKHLMTRRSVE